MGVQKTNSFNMFWVGVCTFVLDREFFLASFYFSGHGFGK
jgi:hypothetical protein